MKHCKVTKYNIPLRGQVRKEGQEAKPLSLVFFSDLHNCISERESGEIMRQMRRLHPDLVLCGGDTVVAKPGVPTDDAVRFLCGIAREFPLYIGTGNHEYRMRIYPEDYGDAYARFHDPVAASGAVFLENTSADVECRGVPLRICGYEMPADYYSRWHDREVPDGELEKIFGRPDPGKMTILFAHHPKMIPQAFSWGADLTLCGHYHGGIIRLGGHRGVISPEFRPFPSNAYGDFQSGAKHAIITSGCGEHTVSLRVHNSREIVSLSLN